MRKQIEDIMKNTKLVGSVRTINNPIICPLLDEINKAKKVLQDFQLSIYQKLYSEGLTLPGNNGLFSVSNYINPHLNCSTAFCEIIRNYPNTPYKFLVKTPEEAYDKCKLIIKAEQDNLKKLDSKMCCPLAEQINCVCLLAYKCPIHGGNHIGSHD